MDLPSARARSGLLLSSLYLTQSLLLLGQRGRQLVVRVMLLEAAGAQLVSRVGQDTLAEVLGSELADEGQACGCEEHLLAHGRLVGDVRHGEEIGGIVVAAEDGVEGGVGLEVGLESGEIVAEGRARGWEGCRGGEGLFLDGDQEAKRRRRLEQRRELSLELLGS